MDVPSPELVAEASARTGREARLLFSLASAASAWAAGAAGTFVCARWGAALGQVGQMYFFLETEPAAPEVAIPWGLVVTLALAPLPAILMRRWGWLFFSALPFAAFPWWFLYRLTLEAAPRA